MRSPSRRPPLPPGGTPSPDRISDSSIGQGAGFSSLPNGARWTARLFAWLAAIGVLLNLALPVQADGAPVPAGVVLAPTQSAQNPLRTIALDPGHGGPDQGAVEGDLVEGDLNLQIVLLTASALRSQGFAVVLTRTGNGPVNPNYAEPGQRAEARRDLQSRIDIANNAGADLLISIHNNASADPSEHGTEVWYDSLRPFADRNLALAQLVLGDVVRQLDAAGVSGFARGVQDDSQFRVFRGRSFQLYLLGPGNTGFRTHQPSAMPAVLAETLFLTSQGDAWALHRQGVLQAIANGYRDAVTDYFAHWP